VAVEEKSLDLQRLHRHAPLSSQIESEPQGFSFGRLCASYSATEPWSSFPESGKSMTYETREKVTSVDNFPS
jgi:hypothetical protein